MLLAETAAVTLLVLGVRVYGGARTTFAVSLPSVPLQVSEGEPSTKCISALMAKSASCLKVSDPLTPAVFAHDNLGDVALASGSTAGYGAVPHQIGLHSSASWWLSAMLWNLLLDDPIPMPDQFL